MLDLLTLTPIQRQIYALVARRPRTADELIAQIWWIHPQDAPGRATIKAHVWAANKRLAAYGLAIRGAHGGRDDYRPYRLVTLGGQDGQPQSAQLDSGTGRAATRTCIAG